MSRYAVIGLGSFGASLARSLGRLGAEVVAVDNEMSHVDGIKDDVHTAICLDARVRDVLEERRIHQVDVAVVCMGEDFEAAEICAVHLTQLGCPRVMVRATSFERAEILRALVPEVIQPSVDAARELALRILAPGAEAYADIGGRSDIAIVRISAETAGVALQDLGLDDRPEVHVLALRRTRSGEEELFACPGGRQALEERDELFLLGPERDLVRAARSIASTRP